MFDWVEDKPLNSVQVPAGASNFSTETAKLLSDTGHLEPFNKSTTSFVDRKFDASINDLGRLM